MNTLLQGELIGTHVLISEASNNSLRGIEGTIVDETKNTLCVMTTKGVKTILKSQVTLLLKGARVKGTLLLGRAEERIKKKKR